MQQRDTYDYTQLGRPDVSRKNTVLRKAYALMGFSFLPCAAGAYLGMNMNLMAFFGHSLLSLVAFIIVFYGLMFIIEKNRYSMVGAAFLMVFTFALGIMLSPVLQLALHNTAGATLVGTAALMTAAVFLVMAFIAPRTKINMNTVNRFLLVGFVVLLAGMLINFFAHLPALYLTIAAGFVIFSSTMIMWQIRTVIDGGEDSYISAALTLVISIYNIFVSLVQILLALTDNR